MMKQPVRVKILHMAELPAQRREKKKRRIHVVRRVRQRHAGDDHPAVDARADEKFMAARQTFRPRARLRAVQAQRVLHRFRRNGADSQPGFRTVRQSRREEVMVNLRHIFLCAPVQEKHPGEDEAGDAQRQKMRHQQHQRRRVVRIHGLNHELNLRPRRAGSIKNLVTIRRQPAEIFLIARADRQHQKFRRVVRMPGDDQFFQRGQF